MGKLLWRGLVAEALSPAAVTSWQNTLPACEIIYFSYSGISELSLMYSFLLSTCRDRQTEGKQLS